MRTNAVDAADQLPTFEVCSFDQQPTALNKGAEICQQCMMLSTAQAQTIHAHM
jgi:hypothetical protein